MTRIDVGTVLRQRVPGFARLMPGFAVRWLERLICQDEMNFLLEKGDGLEGAAFADSVLDNLGITYDVKGDLDPSRRRVVFASNHPLGGLDGLVLCSAVNRLYGSGEMRFIVNDLLTAVEPL